MAESAIPEPWRAFWKEIDETIQEPIELHCLGGFVVTLLYRLKRSTADVDVISVIPRRAASRLLEIAGEDSLLHRKHGVYLDVVGIATVPENYDERLTEIFAEEFQNICLFALDPYDIALIENRTQYPKRPR